MDAGQLVADFVASNIEKIYNIGKLAYGKIDEKIKLNLRLAYDDYLENATKKYSKSKSFFIRDQPVDLYEYYVPTGIECGRHSIERPMFYSCLMVSKRIVISGTGGTGKSVLIKHLFLDCIRDKRYVPVLIELRELNLRRVDLSEHIAAVLSNFGFKMKGEFIEKAMGEGQFCFFFDGYDELDHILRGDVIKCIRDMSDKYSKCPMFISSRPDELFYGIQEFSVFQISPLELETATDLVLKLPYDEEIKQKFVDDMAGGLFQAHRSFLSNPLLLSIMLLTYGVNAEIPSKLSVFYNQAYEALFQRHDANKGGYLRDRLTNLDIQDFSRVFALFSVLSSDRRHFKMSRIQCLDYISKSRDKLRETFKAEDYLSDLLSAACLLIEDGMDIAYSHRSFQEYFVALYISTAAPKVQKKLIERYWLKSDSDSVISLLYELNPDLVERVLVVPQLRVFFRQIGVDETLEHAGVCDENVVRYIKLVCEEIRLERDGFVAFGKNLFAKFEDKRPSDIVSFAMNNIEKFKPRHKSYYDRLAVDLVRKHSKFASFLAVKTVHMEAIDPVVKDLLAAETVYSRFYIVALFDLYLRLKDKHDNYESDFDDLLGI